MNKLMKRFLGVALAVVMVFSIGAAACASAAGFSDVAADAWYADAVAYVSDHDIMSGTSAAAFSPNAATSRAMLAAILYRAAGGSAISASAGFADVEEDAWYTDAVNWAAENHIIAGYGNGRFGTNDPVTREQIASILWRYAGSPSAARGTDFADESAIAAYAADAVDWARASGVIAGKSGNRFDPRGSATRAEVAVILRGYLNRTADTPGTPEQTGKALVVYFSATGSTRTVAEHIADTLDADLFALTPADPYTDDDLNYSDDSSRVVYEHEHPEAQAVELTADTVERWDEYDTVFIGYPIWWGIAAWPVNDFVLSNDFTGKTVIPFCTSASSGLGESGELLEEMAGTGDWLDGQRFSSRADRSDVTEWLHSLGLSAA